MQILKPWLRRYKDANLVALYLIPTNTYGYKVVCCYDDTYTKPIQVYRGEDSIKKFMQEMSKEVQYCQKIISTKFKKPHTDDWW